jgi:hypothetical protein
MIMGHIRIVIISLGLACLITLISILFGVKDSPLEEFAEAIIQTETGINVKPLVDGLEAKLEPEKND